MSLETLTALSRSASTMSASAPTSSEPFRGYRPKIFAGFSQATSTIRSSESLPWWTPSSITGSNISTREVKPVFSSQMFSLNDVS